MPFRAIRKERKTDWAPGSLSGAIDHGNCTTSERRRADGEADGTVVDDSAENAVVQGLPGFACDIFWGVPGNLGLSGLLPSVARFGLRHKWQRVSFRQVRVRTPRTYRWRDSGSVKDPVVTVVELGIPSIELDGSTGEAVPTIAIITREARKSEKTTTHPQVLGRV